MGVVAVEKGLPLPSGIPSGRATPTSGTLFGAVCFVVLDLCHFRQRVPLIEPAAEIDQPATIAAERQRR